MQQEQCCKQSFLCGHAAGYVGLCACTCVYANIQLRVAACCFFLQIADGVCIAASTTSPRAIAAVTISLLPPMQNNCVWL
jgi:hypothetical protein